jgi:hypothetical protein
MNVHFKATSMQLNHLNLPVADEEACQPDSINEKTKGNRPLGFKLTRITNQSY